MTTTTATQQPRPLEPLIQDPSVAASASASSSVSGPCILFRLSRWLWSCRANQPSGSSSANNKTASIKTTLSTNDEETLSESGTENAFPCRACKAWGVECNRQKPRCAHCLDQQILCFYVEPLRVTMKRSREERGVLRMRTGAVTAGRE